MLLSSFFQTGKPVVKFCYKLSRVIKPMGEEKEKEIK
jgi:hypothetical protein